MKKKKKATRKDWERLLVRSAKDNNFRRRFAQDPHRAAANLRVADGKRGLEKLKQVKTLVKGLGSTTRLKQTDARFWAIGLMQHLQVPEVLFPGKPN